MLETPHRVKWGNFGGFFFFACFCYFYSRLGYKLKTTPESSSFRSLLEGKQSSKEHRDIPSLNAIFLCSKLQRQSFVRGFERDSGFWIRGNLYDRYNDV